jgi:hypothetical protein
MNKEIVFVIHQKGTQGSYLNHLDMQQYLHDHEDYKITFYCEDVKKLFDVIKNSRRSYKFHSGSVKILKNEIIEPVTAITDVKSLIKLKESNTFVACKRVLVMDSVELTYHLKDMKHARFYFDDDLQEVAKTFYADEIIFFMPENNYHLFKEKYPNLKCEIFYKNINVDMINTLQCGNSDGYFFRWDDGEDRCNEIKEVFGQECFKFDPDWDVNKKGVKVPFKYNEPDYIFDFKNLIYRRRKYLEYQEQFGRLIFEYILLGKTVYFLDEPYTDDGLTDYLKHFDIKFDGNKVVTTREELHEKMKSYKYKPWEEQHNGTLE